MKKLFSRYFIPNQKNGFRPYVLRKQSLHLFLAFFFALEIAVLVQLAVVFKVTDFLAAVLPGALVTLTNEERTDLSLDTLTVSPVLEAAAQMKANDMATKEYFAHTSPEGVEPWYWLRQVGYGYIFAGENLAVNFSESADVSKAWMNSESHKKNIISDKYTEIGIATAEGMYKGKKTTFVVQYFGRPAVAAPAPAKNPILVEQPAAKPSAVPSKTPQTQTQSASQPIAVAETPTNNSQVIDLVAVPEVEGEQSILKSTLTKVTSSPRLYANFMIGILIGLLLGVLIISVLTKIHVQHPKMIAASLAVVVLGMGLITMNNALLGGRTELPPEDQTASTFMAF